MNFKTTFFAAACMVLTVPAFAQDYRPTPEQRYFEWTALPHDAEVYSQRRSRMMEQLRASGIDLFIVPGAHGRSHGLTFRQTDDFLYFSGLEVPHSILVLDAQAGKTSLFTPRRDARFESASRTNDFPGRPLADDPELTSRSGIDAVHPYDDFESELKSWIEGGRVLSVNLGKPGRIGPIETDFVMDWNPSTTIIDHIYDLEPGLVIRNAYPNVARLRMVKGPEELETIRRVCELTVTGIREAAKHIGDGVDERTLEAELEAVYKRGGAQRLSFSSIIKSGPNSLWPWRILATHNNRRNRKMSAGELVIFDVGTELDYYVSDVGRTFPVSGRFTDAQAAKLEMSTAVADAIISAVRPGITFGQLLEVATAAIPQSERKYMQTGSFFGHHVGMSAGDPSLLDAPLEPGMVFTVEPWYYNHDEGISVFVEDVILVTDVGAEILTSGLPRSPAELAALVGMN